MNRFRHNPPSTRGCWERRGLICPISSLQSNPYGTLDAKSPISNLKFSKSKLIMTKSNGKLVLSLKFKTYNSKIYNKG